MLLKQRFLYKLFLAAFGLYSFFLVCTLNLRGDSRSAQECNKELNERSESQIFLEKLVRKKIQQIPSVQRERRVSEFKRIEIEKAQFSVLTPLADKASVGWELTNECVYKYASRHQYRLIGQAEYSHKEFAEYEEKMPSDDLTTLLSLLQALKGASEDNEWIVYLHPSICFTNHTRKLQVRNFSLYFLTFEVVFENIFYIFSFTQKKGTASSLLGALSTACFFL